jgi:hypothetical protein
MLEPVFVEAMNEHADCELSHSDFLQHHHTTRTRTLSRL